MRNSKGITLVALVVTIIVLLILAGVSLNLMLGNDGIMNKTISAVEETNEASAKEQVSLKIAEFQTEYYEKKYKEHTIEADKQVGDWIFETYGETEISTTDYVFTIEKSNNVEEQASYQVVIEKNSELEEIVGILSQKGEIIWQDESIENKEEEEPSQLLTQANLTVENVTGMSVKLKVEIIESEQEKVAGYNVYVNNKLEQIAEENQIQVTGLKGNTKYSVFVKVLDKEGRAKKTNVLEFSTPDVTFLYHEGDKCLELTGDWKFTPDIYSSLEIVEEKRIYAKRWEQSCGGWAISTNTAIDISNYTKLYCKYTAGSNVWSDGLRLRINNTIYTSQSGGEGYATYNSSCFDYDKTDCVFEWDISQIPDGVYYIGIGGSGASETYIDSIWFE